MESDIQKSSLTKYEHFSKKMYARNRIYKDEHFEICYCAGFQTRWHLYMGTRVKNAGSKYLMGLFKYVTIHYNQLTP